MKNYIFALLLVATASTFATTWFCPSKPTEKWGNKPPSCPVFGEEPIEEPATTTTSNETGHRSRLIATAQY